VLSEFDSAGNSGHAKAHKPFGEVTDIVTDGAVFMQMAQQDKGFVGERFEAGAGLQYLNARYYDPRLGLFLQPDWF
jgi:RHS repeat-associated protein